MAFELFTQTEFSDNRFQYIMEHSQEEITIGGDVTHVFELPFIYSEQIKSGKIAYKQGLNIIETFIITEDMITEDIPNNRSFVSVHLYPVTTSKFELSYLDTFCQMMLLTKNDETIFDDPHPIFIKKPIFINSEVR